jgi:hypothetical protein
MPLWCGNGRLAKAFFFRAVAVISFSQSAAAAPAPQHFDHVIIVVLENQDYDSAIRNDLLKSLAEKGAIFTNFGSLYHDSYPNYLAMTAGSDFGTHTPRIFSDTQRNFNVSWLSLKWRSDVLR